MEDLCKPSAGKGKWEIYSNWFLPLVRSLLLPHTPNCKCANSTFAVKITDDQTWKCLSLFQLPVYVVLTKPS